MNVGTILREWCVTWSCGDRLHYANALVLTLFVAGLVSNFFLNNNNNNRN